MERHLVKEGAEDLRVGMPGEFFEVAHEAFVGHRILHSELLPENRTVT